MAITSVGYDGTVDEVQWASMVSKVGGYEYGVDKAGDFAVSQSAGTRMITIAAGLAWGRGVMDISDAASVIQLDAVTTGSRYDLIAIRRAWGPVNGGPSELVVIKGTSAKTLPANRHSNPGVSDDQPLALVRVQSGSASIPEIIDLRVWGRNGGQLFAKNDLVRSYLATVGTELNVAGVLWQYVPSTNGTAAWIKHGTRSDSGWVTINTGWKSGWGAAGDYIRYKTKNGITQLLVRFTRTGASIPLPSHSDLSNIPVCVIPSAAQPSSTLWNPLSSGGVGRLAAGFAEGNTVSLASIGGTGTLAKGDSLSLGGTYFSD